MTATVAAVARSPVHGFSKATCDAIDLVAGLGVAGDAHMGATVKHRSRVARDPTQPNLRQVHVIHAELFGELAAAGFDVAPGALGENITTTGVALLALPRGTRLEIGESAVIEITGLRNPCVQIERFRPGLLDAVLTRDAHGALVRKTGVMGIVHAGGWVRAGDRVHVVLPSSPHVPLRVV